MTWCNIGGSAFLLMLTVGATRAESPEPYGIEERIPWTTSRVIGSPDPPSPYVVEVDRSAVELVREWILSLGQ